MAVLFKKIIKKTCPPFLIDMLKVYQSKKTKSGFSGNIANWDDALTQTSGWNSPEIINKIKTAALQVKDGSSVYEQDGSIFNKQNFFFPVLAGILRAVTKNQSISIVDFGGSLGSHYYQMKSFFSKEIKISWNVVEQKEFVDCGKKEFENDELKFYYSIKDYQGEKDVFFASGAIQYLEDPYTFIKEIKSFKFKNIIFDRVFFIENVPERIVLQKADAEIFYDASFPAWLLNEDKFIEAFLPQYNLVTDFNSLDPDNKIENFRIYHKGFILTQN